MKIRLPDGSIIETKNHEVPAKRDTKLSKLNWGNRTSSANLSKGNRSKSPGWQGSTSYRAARDIVDMIEAQSTGCVTLEEYYRRNK
jgi:hypothetical protein